MYVVLCMLCMYVRYEAMGVCVCVCVRVFMRMFLCVLRTVCMLCVL